MRASQTLVEVGVTGADELSVGFGEGATTPGVQEKIVPKNRKASKAPIISRARHVLGLVMS